MKLLLLPFIVVAAFDSALFALAHIGRRIARKRTADEVFPLERRSSLRSPASAPGRDVRVSLTRKQSRAADSHPAVAPVTHTFVQTSP